MDPRIETSLNKALDTGDFLDLLERAQPGLGLPGTKPRLELAHEIGLVIANARERGRGKKLARLLGASEREDARILAAASFAVMALNGTDRKEALDALQELADDTHGTIRIGVIDAVRTLLTADLEGTLRELVAWTDGFLQAHVALEAITDRKILVNIPSAQAILDLLEPAFRLADEAPRAADRWQGVRLLRSGLPSQIAAFVSRFSELYAWVTERAAATRPETREVIELTAEALTRAQFRRSEVDALRGALGKSAKPPRDPSRIVHGTRKRSKR
ncbi:MAG: hypothetical protein U0441_23920 [Polyangiaceae bacterium]